MSLPFGNNSNGNPVLNSLAASFLNQGSGSLANLSHLINQNIYNNALQTQIASQSLTYTNQTFMNTLIPIDPLVNLSSIANTGSLLGPVPLPVPVPKPFTAQSVTSTASNLGSHTYTNSTSIKPLPALPQAEQSTSDAVRKHPDQSPVGVSSWGQQYSQKEIDTSSKRHVNATDGILGEPPVMVTKTSNSKANDAKLPSVNNQSEIPMILNCNTAKHASQHKVRTAIHSREVWHKFTIVQGAEMDKEKVLKRILDFVLPTFMIPCLYQKEGEDAFFLARNCGNSIDRLCRRNLIVPPDSHFQQVLQLTIHLEYAKANDIRVNTSTVLNHTLKKRLSSDLCLDLADYHHDPDLERLMFFPLSQPIILHYVLSAAVARLGTVSAINLSNNQIRTVKTLDILLKMSNLRTIDLRNNELLYKTDLEDLKVLSSQITHLYLDGNPLCAEFKTPRAYISYMKSIFPRLESLDGVTLCCGSVNKQNYIPVERSIPLVDQFLRHYFNRYDWEDRNVLDGLYHPEALLSLTCAIVPSKIQSHSLAPYSPYNRNLLCLSDFSQVQKRLYKGSAAVLEFLCALPASSHDPYSFRVDMLQFSKWILGSIELYSFLELHDSPSLYTGSWLQERVKDMQATLSVQGVFKELLKEENKEDPLRSFNRVFVISSVGRNEWQIVNEVIHISNATEKQVSAAFRYKKPPLEKPVETSLWQGADLLQDNEKSRLVTTLVQLSTMNVGWAIRYLKEAKWNLREALINFVTHCESEKIPSQAFIPDKV